MFLIYKNVYFDARVNSDATFITELLKAIAKFKKAPQSTHKHSTFGISRFHVQSCTKQE